MHKGIDVSSNNGTLDWNAIKADGIQFAMIRIGYGNDEVDQDDAQANANMDACQNLAIPYGVYIYSYAITEDEVGSEVRHTIRMIQGRNPQLGVFIDMEDSDGYKANHNLVPEQNGTILTDFCVIYCDDIINAGYKAGVYANKYYYDNILDVLRFDAYLKWLAIWGPTELPAGDWILWQYASDGTVKGSSVRTDLNYYYGELPSAIPTPSATATPTPSTTATATPTPTPTPTATPTATPSTTPTPTPTSFFQSIKTQISKLFSGHHF